MIQQESDLLGKSTGELVTVNDMFSQHSQELIEKNNESVFQNSLNLQQLYNERLAMIQGKRKPKESLMSAKKIEKRKKASRRATRASRKNNR